GGAGHCTDPGRPDEGRRALPRVLWAGRAVEVVAVGDVRRADRAEERAGLRGVVARAAVAAPAPVERDAERRAAGIVLIVGRRRRLVRPERAAVGRAVAGRP